MTWQSVEELQQFLAQKVFHQSGAPRKAAGRALGTLVEIITFYLLKSWGLEHSTLIERRLPEYANSAISHNVEFTLHPSETRKNNIVIEESGTSITPRKMLLAMSSAVPKIKTKSATLVSSKGLLKNSCVLYEDSDHICAAYLNFQNHEEGQYSICVQQLTPHPYGVVECKRVGIEEGVGKGPQTIEKAKQGAYVARTVSSLQRVRRPDGKVWGVFCHPNGKIIDKPYHEFLREIVQSNDPILLKDFTLTVGVVSNHGNWFTSNDHNKEIKVLAQSYDWLLFLTDEGLVAFISDLILGKTDESRFVKDAFLASYGKVEVKKPKNRFTKTEIDLQAHWVLCDYFKKNILSIERWFNVIAPEKSTLSQLCKDLHLLVSKDWKIINNDRRTNR